MEEQRKMTEAQLKLARHALGLPNKSHQAYRNSFCAGPDHEDWQNWLTLVDMGLATRVEGELWGGQSMFSLTSEGAHAAVLAGEEANIGS